MNTPCCAPPTTDRRLHIGLAVRSVPDATRFYEALFGAAPVSQKEDYAKFDLRNPDVVLSLVPQSCCGGTRANHFGIRLDDPAGMDDAADALAERGLSGDRAVEDCCHATQDKLWVEDPDGHPWELYGVLEDRS